MYKSAGKHYKALVEIKEKKNLTRDRVLYIRSSTGIVGVMEICRKIRNSKLLQAKEISLEQYIKGVSK